MYYIQVIVQIEAPKGIEVETEIEALREVKGDKYDIQNINMQLFAM